MDDDAWNMDLDASIIVYKFNPPLLDTIPSKFLSS